MSETTAVSISIMDKEYKISCPVEQQQALMESAALLNRKMRETRENGGTIGSERLAVITALNLTHELLSNHKAVDTQLQSIAPRIRSLESKINATLNKIQPPSA